MKYEKKTKEIVLNFYIEENEVVIDMLYVPTQLRGMGLATKEMQNFIYFVKENSEDMNVDCISICAYAQDDTTVQSKLVEFYLDLGFCSLGESGGCELMEYKIF